MTPYGFALNASSKTYSADSTKQPLHRQTPQESPRRITDTDTRKSLLFQAEQSLFGRIRYVDAIHLFSSLLFAQKAPFHITILPPHSRKQRGSCNHRLTQTLCRRVKSNSIKPADHAECKTGTSPSWPWTGLLPLIPRKGTPHSDALLHPSGRPREHSRRTASSADCDSASRAVTLLQSLFVSRFH